MKKFCALLCILLCVMSLLVLPVQAANTDPLLLGDLDGTPGLAPSDARAVLRISVGLDETTEENEFIADVDGNGEIAPADARLVLRASVGLESVEKFYHYHTNEAYNTKGSCTEPQITGEICTVCGAIQIQSIVNAPGHKWKFVLSGDSHMGECETCGKVENGKCELVEISRTEATCSADGEVVRNCVCGLREAHEVLPGGHIYSAWTKRSDGNVSRTCSRCKGTQASSAANLLTWIADNADRITEDASLSQNMTAIDAATNKITPNGKYTGIFKLDIIKNEIESGMAVDTFTCDGLRENRQVIFNEHSVIDTLSKLSAEDIKSVDVTLGTTVDVLSNIPASFPGNGSRVYDMSAYVNTPAVTDAIRIALTLPEEIATKTGTDGNGKNTYAFTLDGKSVADDVVLPSEKFDMSLRSFAGAFPEVESSDGMYVSFDCSKVKMNNAVVLYFDAETLEPIAIKYTCALTLDQSVSMSGDFGDESWLNGLTEGSMGIDTYMSNDYIYLFSNYYPCMAD